MHSENHTLYSFNVFSSIALLLLTVWLAGSCTKSVPARRPAPHPKPASASSHATPPEAARLEPPKPAGPITEPNRKSTIADDEDSPATAEGLISTLSSWDAGEASELQEKYLAVLQQSLGKPLIPGSKLLALALTREEELVGAIVGVLPPGHVYCSDTPAEQARAFWLTPKGPAKNEIQLVEISTQIFDGSSPKLTIPETYPDVPFLELSGSRECPVPGFEADPDLTKTEVNEIWILTAQGPKRFLRLESGADNPLGSGGTQTTDYTLTWVHGDDNYLAVRKYNYSSAPANAGDGDDDRVIVHCKAKTTIYQLNAKGQAVELSASKASALRKPGKALATLAPDGKGSDDDTCSDLEKSY